MDLGGTIVALGSPLAASRRAIVRLSGVDSKAILNELFVGEGGQTATEEQLESKKPIRFEASCRLQLRNVGEDDANSFSNLNVACYWWPTSRSYTGEPSAEIHLLGSLPLAEAVVDRVRQLGARNAERGEFTLRSFLAGKIDLAQAEAVLGVIEADQDEEMEWALGQLGGNICRPVKALRDQLLEMTAHLEAGLDFVEEDIEFISSDALRADILEIRGKVTEILNSLLLRSTRNRDFVVSIVGRPNAGKSSLFNALLADSRAIVSHEAGTTRDAVAQGTTIGSHEVQLVDTAGIEAVLDQSPRSLAQQVVGSQIDESDLLLLCQDSTRPIEELEAERNTLQSSLTRQILNAPESLGDSSATSEGGESETSKRFLVLGTKRDLPGSSDEGQNFDQLVCSHDQQDVERLKHFVSDALQRLTKQQQSSAMHHAALRSKASLEQADEALGRCLELLDVEAGEELIAAELRAAIDDLSAIIGEVHTEDLLGQIFSRFCIGK